MIAAGHALCRAGSLALVVALAVSDPCLAKPKRVPARVDAPCLPYAPDVVGISGVLHREAFSQPPIEDLFVSPDDPEVGEPPPDDAPADAPPPGGAPPLASAVPPPPSSPSPALAADPAFIGPLMPVNATATPIVPAIDPVLLRARPAKRPPPGEFVWVLKVRPDICVAADPTDRVNTSEKRVRELQLVLDPDVESSLARLRKKTVVVHGQLFHALSRRHYLPVLINVETIRPPEWTPELTELQPLRRLSTTPR